MPFCAGCPPTADDTVLLEATRLEAPRLERMELSTAELTATELAATELTTTVLGAKNAAVVVVSSGAYVNMGGA